MDYRSKSQLARIETEAWVTREGYCLACESDRLLPTPTNTQARDFECEVCGHPYELKSSRKPFGMRVVDGAYASMMRRVHSGTVPSFILLCYLQDYSVTELSVIHRSLITPEVIQERKPLAPTARRAGWVGCNILIGHIPPEGRVSLLSRGIAHPKSANRAIFQTTDNIAEQSLGNRRWVLALLRCLHRLSHSTFKLEEAYSFETELSSLYPHNRNIRAKIRQQLQVLRDAGLVVFLGNGTYRLTIS